jgi:DNA modification methylase
MQTLQLIHNNCLTALQGMDDCSVDSIVTDPPYGLSFMGRKWDYDVPSKEIWAECLRVLKPGGHLLAFAGTRTQHRMCVNIEDAGFEIRDMIAWVYGSGFPKSMDISKALDRRDAKEKQEMRRERFTEWVRSTGVTARQIDEATGTNMGGHYTTAASQPAIMTREHLNACRHLLGDVPEWVEREADIRSVESENFKARALLRTEARYNEASGIVAAGRDERKLIERRITAPATPEAQQWDGWGTALKPALEPITVARKPFKGTVANNVLTHDTGAINIDGCRVGGDDGRWPANLIHDGSEEPCELLSDAARFFYCAKASKKDREDGNTHPTVKPTDLMSYLCRLVTPADGVVLDPFMGSGSTGKAAMREGFGFIGIEREAEYFAIAEQRVKHPDPPNREQLAFA